jgi:hypothetical protein
MAQVEAVMNVDADGLLRLAADGALLCGELTPELRSRVTDSLGEGVRLAGVAAGTRRAGFIAQRALAARRRGDVGEPAAVDAMYAARQAE